MKRIIVLALVAVAVLALAPPARATESRLIVAPLTFEEGGDGTGYVTFSIPAGESWSLVRYRAVHRDGIDIVAMFDDSSSSPVDYSGYQAGVTGYTRVFSPPFNVTGSALRFIVCTVTNTDSPTGGFVRIRVTVN